MFRIRLCDWPVFSQKASKTKKNRNRVKFLNHHTIYEAMSSHTKEFSQFRPLQIPFLTSTSMVGRRAKNFFNRLFTWVFSSLRSSLLEPPARKEKYTLQSWRKQELTVGLYLVLVQSAKYDFYVLWLHRFQKRIRQHCNFYRGYVSLSQTVLILGIILIQILQKFSIDLDLFNCLK